MKLENDGFSSSSLTNVPAYRDEPMMPAEENVRPWMLVFYHDDNKRQPDKYWNDIGKEAYRDLKLALKTNDEIRQAAQKAVEGASDDNDKVLRLIHYVRGSFRDLWGRDVTDAEREKVLKQYSRDRLRTVAEIFKSGIGIPDELNRLFAALASEAGLEARPAYVASRNDITFHPQMVDIYFLPNIDMAVKIGGEWKLYDVSARMLPPNMLSWHEEGQQALLSDPKTPAFIQSPFSPPEASTLARTAKLSLSSDGTLEGTVEELYTGHAASERRSDYYGESEERQREELKDDLVARYPQSEIADIRIENVDKTDQPLKLQYRVKIPGYAQRTGRRLFFHPVFFQRGAAPRFAAAERKYDIHFRYAFNELENVTINLPEGYELDSAENPGSLNFGKPGGYTLNMAVGQNREFVCTRQLMFGKDNMLFFPQAAYSQIKAAFDEVHRRDNHTISLKAAGAGS
jgi:hypothetical protein